MKKKESKCFEWKEKWAPSHKCKPKKLYYCKGDNIDNNNSEGSDSFVTYLNDESRYNVEVNIDLGREESNQDLISSWYQNFTANNA